MTTTLRRLRLLGAAERSRRCGRTAVGAMRFGERCLLFFCRFSALSTQRQGFNKSEGRTTTRRIVDGTHQAVCEALDWRTRSAQSDAGGARGA
jgi:hypothetical protein